MITDIQPNTKCCSKCDQSKEVDMFIKKRNICKMCANTRKKGNICVKNS